MVGSMGRVGAAADNAAMEVSSAYCKNRLRQAGLGHPRGQRIAIVTWIERTYHRRRRQDSLGLLTPADVEATIAALGQCTAWQPG